MALAAGKRNTLSASKAKTLVAGKGKTQAADTANTATASEAKKQAVGKVTDSKYRHRFGCHCCHCLSVRITAPSPNTE